MYGDGSEIYWATTSDYGTTWQNQADFGGGLLGDFDSGSNGIFWDFKLVQNADGQTWDVWNRMRNSKDFGTIRDWTMTTITAIDGQSIAARESVGNDGAWRIGVFYSSGGSWITKYSPDGLKFN